LFQNLQAIVKLARPHQYIKNLFIFLPLFFALKIGDLPLLLNTALAFIAFSMAASGVYILNDYLDIEDDKRHPKKKYRPLASGAVSKRQGVLLMTSFIVGAIVLVCCVSMDVAYVLIAYVMMNFAYSMKLKHIAILDVNIIAIGFVLRLYAGSFITDTKLSVWIIVITFLLALFLALAKRRDDVLLFEKTGTKARKVIDGYNLQFLDISMAIMAAVVIVSYVLYTTSVDVIARVGSDYLFVTAFFVILGILRYLQISFVLKNSGSPTKIVLSDTFIQATITGWLITFGWILY